MDPLGGGGRTPEEVLAKYGLHGAQVLAEFRGDDAVVWVLDHADGPVAAKLHRHQTPAAVLEEAELLVALERAGAPCPNPVRGHGGTLIVDTDVGPVTVCRYVTGVPCSSTDDPGAVAAELALLHRSTLGWMAASRHSDHELIMQVYELLRSTWPVSEVNGIPATDLWCEALRSASRLRSQCLPRSAIHHDPHPGNVVRHGARHRLIDFGEARIGQSVVDLAALIATWRDDPRLITRTELEGIRDEYQRVRPLHPDEKASLRDAILLVVANGASEYLLRNRTRPGMEPARSASAVLLSELLADTAWSATLREVFG